MEIIKVRNKYVAYAPGRRRIPGEYLTKGQAIGAYYSYTKELKNQQLSSEPEHNNNTPTIDLYVNSEATAKVDPPIEAIDTTEFLNLLKTYLGTPSVVNSSEPAAKVKPKAAPRKRAKLKKKPTKRA